MAYIENPTPSPFPKWKLKSFARRDGNGRVIPGSNVSRKTMPKGGDWFEIPPTQCCTGTTTTLTPT